ncbi:MAG: hypothetical protein K8R02_01620 [Anaerohalosphaeraceae bacterium]|nr:hypothetical protein [Anaerohalosphaeraceae bacterium]
MKIYFTDWFDIDPAVLDNYGALNISLINDLPLFIDPFLLFGNKKKNYCQLHGQIIKYLKYLRDRSIEGNLNEGLLDAWYRFPEVKQIWLGYCLTGNNGRGLGPKFARNLNKNLNVVFSSFGKEQITKGSHIEKVCLIESGVGKDNISDFTANLIKKYLLEYTQKFAQKYIADNMRRTLSIPKVSFDYKLGVWKSECYDLPYINGDHVLLTPKEILSKDENWINRPDLINNFEKIANSVPDQQLRSQVNQYLSSVLYKDKKKEPTKQDKQKAFSSLLKKYPKLIEYYILSKENTHQEATRISKEKVVESEEFFIRQVIKFVEKIELETDFYKYGIDTLAEARARVQFLKDTIENNDGYRVFYNKGMPIQRESDLQILYRLTWFASPSDFNSEVNNGRGSVDFKISRGSKDKSLVEFKLAKNTKLKQNLQKQVEIYKKANKTKKSLKVISYFSVEEKNKVESILQELNLKNDNSIILIDARRDNKPSASNAK